MKLTRLSSILAVIIVIIIALFIILIKKLTQTHWEDPKDQLVLHSYQLAGIAKEWMKEPDRSSRRMDEYVGRWKSVRVQIYTNTVKVDNQTHECLFSVRPTTLNMSGQLVVDTNGIVIWLDDRGYSRIVLGRK